MRNLRTLFASIFLFFTFLTVFKISNILIFSRGTQKFEKEKLTEISNKLNECFDLENKRNRSISESIKLIEYCLKEYGSNKESN